MTFKSRYLAIKVSKGLRIMVFVVNVLIFVLFFLSTKAQTIPPSQSIIISFLGMGFPILFAFNVLFLLLWIVFLQWRYIIVSLLCMSLCWTAISSYFPMKSRSKEVPEQCIKFLTYNVKGFDNKKGKEARSNPIFEYLVNNDADIVCFQEFIVNSKSGDKNDIISLSEFDDIMDAYPYRSVISLEDEQSSSYIYGLACYSKYPIMRVARVPLKTNYNSGSAMFEIKIGRKFITVISNYLESNRITAEDKQLYKDFIVKKDKEMFDDVAVSIQEHLAPAFFMRERQAKAIVANIEKQRPETHAMIVCGDFNSPPMSYTYRTIKGNMVDSFEDTGRGMGITYHENGFLFRIDYIMHTKNIKSYNCTIDRVKYSDHYPLYSYLFIDYI